MSYYGDRRDRDRGASDRDRLNPCRLYIGQVGKYVEEQDIRDLFKRFGRIKDLLFRHFYAFVEYEDVRDAEDACKKLDGYKLRGERLIVQVANPARNTRRDDYNRNDYRNGRDEYDNRRSDKCYNCGESGHIASDCKSSSRRDGERSNRSREDDRCRECGDTSHKSRDCPKRESSSRRRSRSASPRKYRRSDENRGRSRSPRRPSPNDIKRAPRHEACQNNLIKRPQT